MSASARCARWPALGRPAWLVGGRSATALLDRPTSTSTSSSRARSRACARAGRACDGGHAFQLSEAFGAWRVVAHDRSWQVDLIPLAGETIEDDLGGAI